MIWQRKELGHRIMLASSRIETPRSIGPIAVLPFSNMSGDPEQDYFSDGISQDIITALVLILPDGQITSDFQKSCQAPFAKIFLFSPTQISSLIRAVPSHKRGVRDRHERGAGCGGRGQRARRTRPAAYGEVVWF